MKLTFRDLKQQKFVIEAEPTELISDVKAKIEQEKGWEAAQQKLIYSGKILQDANTVESYKIEEKGFIVCMVSKPKPAPAPAAAKVPSTPAPAAAAATPAAPQAPQAPAASTSNTAAIPSTPSPAGPGVPATTAPAPAQPQFNDPSSITMGAQRAEAVANLESMGFARADIDAAMRAAYFNPDRAVEYLLNGIPENLQREQRPAAQAAPQGGATSPPAPGAQPAPAQGGDDGNVNLFEAAANAGRGGSGGGGARGGSNPFAAAGTGAAAGAGAGAAAAGAGGAQAGLGNLDWLRNNPQFQQLRQVVQQQPQMLEPILQSVGAGNPQLAQLIGQHPDQFLQLLGEEIEEGDAMVPPGATQIPVTPEESEAIERLCGLGFDRDLAIQAYFACDKNEELAANFLFEQPDEDDGPN